MPDPTILRVHYAYPHALCKLRGCPAGHWWRARCDKAGCDWHGTYGRKFKAEAALEKHGEKGCGHD